MTAPARLPPRGSVAAELARRFFPDWCARNIRIVDKAGVDRPFLLNRVQRRIDAIEAELLRTRGEARVFILKARQPGVTTHQQVKSLHTVITVPGTSALTIAHDPDATEKIFQITKHAVECFPAGELPDLGEKQTREISFPSLNSRFYTAGAPQSGGRVRTGRGLTLRRVHASEFAFWAQPKKTLNAVTPALVPQRSVVVIETTASGFETEAHQFWKAAKAGANDYHAVFFPWWECDPANYRRALEAPDQLGTLADDEQVLVTAHGLALEEIHWRRHMIRAMGGKDEFLQEYPEDDESCWLAAGGMYYPAEQLRALMQRAPQPIDTAMGGELLIYAEANSEAVVMGADTAEGVGQDRSTFVARAFPSWRLLAQFASSTIQPKEFAGVLDTWGRKLGESSGEPAYQVVEKNMHGITVLRHLRDDHRYPVARIYHRTPLDQAHPEASERIGWATTEESKAIMLGAGRELLQAATEGLAGVPSREVVTDAFAVRRGDNGRYTLTGKDMLVAEMLAWIGRAPSNAGSGRAMLAWMSGTLAAQKAKRDAEVAGTT